MSTEIASLSVSRPRPVSVTRVIGAALLLALAAFAVLGPWLVQADPAQQNFSASLAPIGGEYLFGADHYGRSLLARLAHGARLSFGMAFLTMLTPPSRAFFSASPQPGAAAGSSECSSFSRTSYWHSLG